MLRHLFGEIFRKGRRPMLKPGTMAPEFEVQDHHGKTVRLAVGGASHRPFVADEASAALSNTALEPDAVEAAGAACVEAAEPSDDIRASADYRAHLLPIYVRRVLDQMKARRSQGAT